MNKNLKLWSEVEKTNPKYTKKAKVGGNNITSISPQFQILNATEQFGSYGSTWGFRNIKLDYSITNTPISLSVIDWNTKKTEKVQSVLGLVGFKATFFYPDGEFEITNSIKIFTDNKHSKIDDNYAKKLETDALTKALSKLGFNADIFLGKFDDVRYVEEMNNEFDEISINLKKCSNIGDLEKEFKSLSTENQKKYKEITISLKNKLLEKEGSSKEEDERIKTFISRIASDKDLVFAKTQEYSKKEPYKSLIKLKEVELKKNEKA